MGDQQPKYFPRSVVAPPGLLNDLQVLDYEKSLDAIKNGSLSEGARGIIRGLLAYGGVAQFPAGLGIDYNNVFKHVFRTNYFEAAVREIVTIIDGQADVIVTPAMSGYIPAAMIGLAARLPVMTIRKTNGPVNDQYWTVKIDSYTKGTRDTLQLGQSEVASLCKDKNDGPVRAILVDEMIDTGVLTTAAAHLFALAQQEGCSVKMVGAVAPIEKIYTGAGDKLKQDLGLAVHGVLGITDMGINPSWIAVRGISSKALTFAPKK